MPEQMRLQREDGWIAYTDEGCGPPVLMIPGVGDLREEYRFLAAELTAAGRRAVTADLRGMGGSSASGWRSYTNAAIGGDIVALLKHLNAGPAVVIGTSMGSGAAAWAAAEAPQHVSDLVLIGPFVREPRNAATLQGALQRLLIRSAFAGPWGRPAWGAYWSSLFRSRKPADFEACKARLLANLCEPGRMQALRAMLAAPKRDVEVRLAEVRARTLVVMGAADPDFPEPEQEAADVARLLRGRMVMIPGAGHYPHTERPEITVGEILTFLSASCST